ncbi:hypothetical protein [uncultured Roseobacter sp.]|uniref:hypothetical protein n=1 Tax=uncultured Roseobacter sp. TaxID=114847 RepID=UPI0026078516|nr:hypothetical protein [uncultured Roseobacter sp.]
MVFWYQVTNLEFPEMRFPPLSAVLMVLPLGVSAQNAEPRPIMGELDISHSDYGRSGNGLAPTVEAPEFDRFDVAARLALPFAKRGRVQFSLDRSRSDAPDTLPSGNLTDDTFRYSSSRAVQLGLVDGPAYFGAFAVAGDIEFTPVSAFDNSDFTVWGIETAWVNDRWSIGAQLGRLEVEADDEETINDATIISVSGAYYFNNGHTRLSARIGLADGHQDSDDLNPDPTWSRIAGIELEHQFKRPIIGSARGAVYAGVDFWDTEETNTPLGNIEILNDRVFTLGVRFTFGAGSLRGRDKHMAPRLPKFGPWIASTTAVD